MYVKRITRASVICLAFAMIVSYASLYSQDSSDGSTRHQHAIFLEVTGLAFSSLNYDLRLNRNISLRVLAGFFAVDTAGPTDWHGVGSFAATASYLLPLGNHNLEVNGGLLLFLSPFERQSAWSNYDPLTFSTLKGIAGVGYRLQPRNGVFFRGGGIVVVDGGGALIAPTLSLGIAF